MSLYHNCVQQTQFYKAMFTNSPLPHSSKNKATMKTKLRNTKRYLTLLLGLLFATLAGAQTTVRGLLTDSLSHEPEPYATVRIYPQQQQQTPVAMVLSNAEGSFTATVKQPGRYVAVCSAVGKTPCVKAFTIAGEKDIDLGTLLLSDKESVMQSVEVTAQKPIVRMEADKMTYSVEDDVDSRSMSVLDMLRKVPMVMVDGQDNISISGQSSFKVYVDGKPNMMLSANPSQILKAMPASMVKSIEVVTSPGAKYDAEGAGGILNFQLASTAAAAAGGAAAQDLSAYNGSLTAQGGNRGVNLAANVSGQQKRLSYNADFTYAYMNNGNVDVDIQREQLTDGTATDLKMGSRNTVPFMLGNIGLGYAIDKQSQVNASFGVQRMQVTNKGDLTTSLGGGALGTGLAYSNRSKSKIANTSFNGSFDYQRFFDPKRESSLTVTYQVSSTPSQKDSWSTDYRMLTTGLLGVLPADRMSDGEEHTTEHVAQVDLVNRVAPHSKLNTGLKYANRFSTSDMDYYDLSHGQHLLVDAMSTDYEHRNQIGALYAESENAWTKWSLKGGLRYEHTWQNVLYRSQNGESFHTNYGNLVPSLTTSFTIAPGQSLGATYNMRISRPGITYLNPYVERSESTSLQYGNPDLDVEETNNVSLVYNLYTPKLVLNATLAETLANGGIEQYSFYDAEGRLNTTYGNIVDRRLTALTVFASWGMTKTTRLTLNTTATYSHLTSSVLDERNSGWSARAMLNIQQTLPKTWILSLVLVSNTKRQKLQGWDSGFNLGVLTLSKSFLHDRLNLSLTGVTGLSKGGRLHIKQFSEGANFTSKTDISVPVARFALSARWTFGNSQKRFQQHKTKVQSDYIEHKSDSESIGSAGQM